MRITILTLFPEMFEGFLNTSIVGRAVSKEIVVFDFVNIRDFAHNKYKHVDDTPFGGGAGMVMQCQPVLDALHTVKTPKSHTLLMSAAGQPFTQSKARALSKQEHLILLCGHYEGFDERIVKEVDEEISVGDYILTGGELPSMLVCDAVVRLLEGAIKEESTEEESYENGLLEYPQYTKPSVYEGEAVPEVLLSGHHENIRKWRLLQSLIRTKERRPDLFEKHVLSKEEKELLESYYDQNQEH